MHNIGTIQGRLTPSNGRGIQFFPFDNWQKEFELAKKVGLYDIEFIFDLPDYQKNPFWTENGIEEIKKQIETTGVLVNHICADYFMRKPLSTSDEKERIKRVEVLKYILNQTKKIGGKTIEIPLLETASVRLDENDAHNTKTAIEACLPLAEELGLQIGLETDLEPEKLLAFVRDFKSRSVVIVYDTGNSASLGYDPEEELETYGELLSSVQIKDRIKGGTTVPLGSGNTDFEKVFQALKKVTYKKDFILQVARGSDGDESNTISSQIAFVNNLITTYLK